MYSDVMFQKICEVVEADDVDYSEQMEDEIYEKNIQASDLITVLTKLSEIRSEQTIMLHKLEEERGNLTCESLTYRKNLNKLSEMENDNLDSIKRLWIKTKNYALSGENKELIIKNSKEILILLRPYLESIFLKKTTYYQKRQEKTTKELEEIGDLDTLLINNYNYYEKCKSVSNLIFKLKDKISTESFYINYLSQIIDTMSTNEAENRKEKKVWI